MVDLRYLKNYGNYGTFYIFSPAKKMVYVSFGLWYNYGKYTSEMISLAKS